MELQGLREALKVEIQCHQVNERWCYFSLVGGSQRKQGQCEGLRGSALGDSGTPRHPQGSPATHPPLASQIKWTFDGTLADCRGSGPSSQDWSGSAVLLL